MKDVLIIDVDLTFREALAEILSLEGYTCSLAKDAKEGLTLVQRHRPNLVITEMHLDPMTGLELLANLKAKYSNLPILCMTAQASIEQAIQAMRFGAVDYLVKPFNAALLLAKVREYIQSPEDFKIPVAEDESSQALLSIALRVAATDAGVLITGESGSGKEILAHFIHEHSERKAHPFIAINCAAIPEQMLEATLFGYEKGSFTGAYKASAGKFEQAQEGTLLLDEVSEMSLNLQAKLLRVLQEKEVERIGSNKIIKLDVRILATSNRDLLVEVKNGRFREDLFYRLNIFPLHCLPLRERRADIIPLANYLIHRYCYAKSSILPKLSEQAKTALLSYHWPGNVRELDNVVQRALILQNQGMIDIPHLGLPELKCFEAKDSSFATNLQTHEFDLIRKTIQQQDGNRQKAASVLGISERTLRYKLAKMREEGHLV